MSGLWSKRRWLPPFIAALIAAGLQTAALGYMVESRASILRNGKEVLLKTVPVDPRDLLRGDYVILSYDVSWLAPELFKGEWPTAPEETTVFVRLAKQADGFWGASEASFKPLAPTEGSVVLQSQPFTFYPSASENPSSINVAYGIERFYVPEGEGRVLEQARNAEALSVSVRINNAGRAQIRQIAVEGTPVYEETLY
ncbi:GDYXXLXY domain-containing protein [Ensifer canadensis]